MTRLNYYAHLMLYTQYKPLLNLFIFFFIFSLANIFINDNSILECMKSSSNPLSDRSSDKEYIEFLEAEAWRMDNKIVELEYHTSCLQKEVDNLKLENKRLSERLTILENKTNDERKLPDIDLPVEAEIK